MRFNLINDIIAFNFHALDISICFTSKKGPRKLFSLRMNITVSESDSIFPIRKILIQMTPIIGGKI